MSLSDERIAEIADAALRSVDIHVCNRSFVVAAIRTALEESERWQPIETAPKDGTHILALIEYGNQPAIMSFHAGAWHVATEHYTVSCSPFCSGGSVETADYTKVVGWQPLPAPPAQEPK